MAGTSKKRGSDAAETGTTTRASKAAKTDSSETPTKAKAEPKAKKAKTAVVSPETFTAKALPLHINITHTPPSIADADTVPAASEDPGSLGTLTLLPTVFSTGSFGWKGNKRITIELQNDDVDAPKETVTVLLSINAPVAGSKPSKAKKPAATKSKKKKAAESDEEDDEEEAAASDEE